LTVLSSSPAGVESQVAETKKINQRNNWKVPEGFLKPSWFDDLIWYEKIKMSDPEYWETLVEIENWFHLYVYHFDSLSEFLAAYEYQKHEAEEDAWEHDYCLRIYAKHKKDYSGKPKTLECLRNAYESGSARVISDWE